MARKLISFKCLRTGGYRAGLLLPDRSALDIIPEYLPNCHDNYMLSLIQQFSNQTDITKKLDDSMNNLSNKTIYKPQQYQLLAPIPLPRRNLFCVGKNYMDHVQETSTTAEPVAKPKYPQFFSKVPETVIGPYDKIPSHVNTTRWLDYEAELAVIIGKQGVDITVENAMDYIFGYTIANDVSARDVQKRHVQFMKGKCLDGTCPLGPAITLKDDVDAQNLSIKLWINNEIRQNSSTNQMIFNIPEIISQLSKGMTLYPGDIILTGTPAGVGFAMSPPQVLKPNDHIKIEIEGLGVLENTVGS